MRGAGGSFVWVIVATAVGIFVGTAQAAVTLAPSVSLSERYDDNFFFSADNREEEVVTVVSPSLTLAYDSRSLDVAVSYQGSAEFYRRHLEPNTYRQTTSLDLKLPLLVQATRRFDVEVTEAATYTPELPAFSLADQPREANEGIQVGRTNTVRNRAGIVLGYHWSPRTATTLSYLNLLTRFDRADLLDSVAHEAAARIGYRSSTVTEWTAEYRATVTDFETIPTTRLIAHAVAIGVARQVTERFSVSGDLGVVVLEDDIARMTGSLGVSRSYRSSVLVLNYTRGAGSGGGVVSSVTVSELVTGRVTNALGEHVSARIQAGYGKNHSLTGDELRITSYEVGTGISARVRAWLVADLSYSYFSQEAHGPIGSDGERNLVVFTLTGTAVPWGVFQ